VEQGQKPRITREEANRRLRDYLEGLKQTWSLRGYPVDVIETKKSELERSLMETVKEYYIVDC